MAEAAYGSLPFEEQTYFFRRKLNLPTTGWTDVYAHEHDWAFVVAGANRDAIVADFRTAVERAIVDGVSLETFRRDFDAIVARHGWDYNGGRDWRSRVIYETNLAASYAAGRWQQLQDAPFWEYEHQDWVEHPRPHHQALDGLVLAKDDPFWQTHFPPNGWGCKCKVRGRWERDLERMGKTGPDQAPAIAWETREIGQRSINGPRRVRVPEGIDPGFEYAPGATRLRSAMPPERPDGIAGSAASLGLPNRLPLAPLPPAQAVASDRLLPAGLSDEAYVDAFLAPFGATRAQPAIFTDAIGERLVIGKELFQDVRGNWKVRKRGRERYLPLLAEALQDPDEIWVRIEWIESAARAEVRRRYVARYIVDGEDAPVLLVFERGPSGWVGVTAFRADTQSPENWRVGVRLYRRPAENE